MFQEFVQSGLYLRGWSPKTAVIYKRAFRSYGPGPISKVGLEKWVISMREKGQSTGGMNVYIRCLNAYCNWLHIEHGYERVRLKVFKDHPKPVTILTPGDIKLLMASRPKRATYLRTWTLCVLLIDTGIRIDEALRLKPEDIDLPNLLLTVRGKGDRIRRIPFSIEMRKHLFRYMRKLNRPFLFGTSTGTMMSYRNARRGVGHVFRVAGIIKHVHPHLLRHTFASSFIRAGGNIYTLSRLLGHASVMTTERYLRGLQTTELQHLSPLGGLRDGAY